MGTKDRDGQLGAHETTDGDQPGSDPIELKDSVAFWQKELHYYEGRAGEQGASANRLVTIAAGAVAVASILATALEEQTLSPLLLVVPAVVLLMWATATRLLHEMELLRVYREHAEWRLRVLAKSSPSLASYRSWGEFGAKHDMPPVITLTWFFLAGGISLSGTAGVIVLLTPTLGVWTIIVWLVFAVVVARLAYTFGSNGRDSRSLAEALGVPARGEWDEALAGQMS